MFVKIIYVFFFFFVCVVGRVDMHGVRLNFWDLGGQEDLQVLWDKYYAECHAVVYIVDSSDVDRLQESKEAFGEYNFRLCFVLICK